MNKFDFVADGHVTDFHFTFPFFSKNDVVVKHNSADATGYDVFCYSDAINPDFPFTGGRVHFAIAPNLGDVITISRKLELTRTVDYQPTMPLSTMALNQDMNFMLEVLKDMKNELMDFHDKYSEFTDKDSTNVLLNKFDAVLSETSNVISEINTFRQQMNDIGDIGSIITNITNLNNTITSLNTSLTTANSNITDLQEFQDDVLDYVVASQNPTDANSYTWYRKYKSGWVEQGGRMFCSVPADQDTVHTLITLPIEMSDANYNVQITQEQIKGAINLSVAKRYPNATKNPSTSQTLSVIAMHTTAGQAWTDDVYYRWMVSGMSKQ